MGELSLSDSSLILNHTQHHVLIVKLLCFQVLARKCNVASPCSCRKLTSSGHMMFIRMRPANLLPVDSNSHLIKE